jgi:polyisoprenoid-binding protein YceI
LKTVALATTEEDEVSLATESNRSTLPEAGTWTIDPGHSTVGFVARHLMVTKVRGSFTDVEGAATIAEDPLQSSVDVTITTASIATLSADRDAHLRSPDFFDVEQHPTITFRSTGLRHVRGDHWQLDGDLTIKDVTRPVTLDVQFEGLTGDPWGGQRAAFTASTEVDREAWGLNWNVALETGGWLVSKKVKLELDVQLVRQ